MKWPWEVLSVRGEERAAVPQWLPQPENLDNHTECWEGDKNKRTKHKMLVELKGRRISFLCDSSKGPSAVHLQGWVASYLGKTGTNSKCQSKAHTAVSLLSSQSWPSKLHQTGDEKANERFIFIASMWSRVFIVWGGFSITFIFSFIFKMLMLG